MTLPTPREARSRQTAMEAERHWWCSRLMLLRDALTSGRFDDLVEGNEFALERASVKEDIIADLDALIAERTK